MQDYLIDEMMAVRPAPDLSAIYGGFQIICRSGYFGFWKM